MLATLARTPLHPQWLMGQRTVPDGISGITLDIGAADRWIESRLAPGVQYIALDYPATGRDLYAARPDVFADAACLPFGGNCIDTVLCLEVIEHVRDPNGMLAEMARVLRPGGQLHLSMPFLYPIHDAPFDFQRLTEHGLRRDLEAAGLQIVEIRKTGHAIRNAGLLCSLSIGGGIYGRREWHAYSLLPVAAVLIVLVNLLAYLLSLFWPDWNGMCMGYELKATKP